MSKIFVYSGSDKVIQYPAISKTPYTMDFSWGFYVTTDKNQAIRQAYRRDREGVVNTYAYEEQSGLNILEFDRISEEWIDFIGGCRNGYIHDYDIVKGPMVDDTIWDSVNEFFAGRMDKETFWKRIRSEQPAYQFSFHSIRAMDCLIYEKSERLVE